MFSHFPAWSSHKENKNFREIENWKESKETTSTASIDHLQAMKGLMLFAISSFPIWHTQNNRKSNKNLSAQQALETKNSPFCILNYSSFQFSYSELKIHEKVHLTLSFDRHRSVSAKNSPLWNFLISKIHKWHTQKGVCPSHSLLAHRALIHCFQRVYFITY